MSAGPNKIRRTPQLDAVDRHILRILARDARVSNSQLAQSVGVAPSTCLLRVRALVEAGVISAFTASIDPAAVGLGLQALISVSIRSGARQTIAEFSDRVRALPGVVQVYFLGGSEDFMLHIAARDSDELRDFVLEHLSAHPSVASTRTSVIFDHHYNGPQVPGGD